LILESRGGCQGEPQGYKSSVSGKIFYGEGDKQKKKVAILLSEKNVA